MREIHDMPGRGGPDAGRDAPAARDRSLAPGRFPAPGDRVVRDAAARTAYALEYRQRVKDTYATAGASPPDSRGNGKLPLRDTAGRPARSADLPGRTRDLPNARDVLPNLELAQVDERKFSDYSLNPAHPANRGKAGGWRALGYDVDSPQGRREAARELHGLVLSELPARGKVEETRDTPRGLTHRVLNAITGPNGKDGTLVTCWLTENRAGDGAPRLITTWAQPHRDKETGQ